MKVTPAHDPNDFAAGRRLWAPEVVVIDTDGKMTAEAGEFAGLDRFRLRKRVVASSSRSKACSSGSRTHDHAVGHCQRCGTVVEPLVSTQWFVKVEPLAAAAIRRCEPTDGPQIVPASWTKVYFEWMQQHPRLVHLAPALVGPPHSRVVLRRRAATVVVAESDPSAVRAVRRRPLRQDEDVLDTWFSSALWPFSTLGWPETTAGSRRATTRRRS